MKRALTVLTLAAALVTLGASRARADDAFAVRLTKSGIKLTASSVSDDRRAGPAATRGHDRRDGRRDDRRGDRRDDRRDDDRGRHDRGRYDNDRGRHGHDRGRVTIRVGTIPHRRWVPGHYETRTREIRLPDRHERVWVPDCYEVRVDRYGRRFQVLAAPGHYEVRRVPGRVICETYRVWIPGHWESC